MIKYFKELLSTLKSIDAKLGKIAEQNDRIAQCIKQDSHGAGKHIKTWHWNQ